MAQLAQGNGRPCLSWWRLWVPRTVPCDTGGLGPTDSWQGGRHSQAEALGKALKDESPYVRAVAAEALGTFTDDSMPQVLETLVTSSNMVEDEMFPAMYHLNALQMLGDKAVPVAGDIAKLPMKGQELGRWWLCRPTA